MPASAIDRRDPRLLSALFWTGVAFAPVAALILLVADGNGLLRLAAVLAIVAIVLIGLSIALRPDGAVEVEELRDEIEQVRRELHGEIVAVTQRGDQALDASQRAEEQVAALRRRLDAAASEIGGEPAPPPAEPAGAGRAPLASSEGYDDAGRARVGDDVPSGRARVAREDDEAPGRRPRPNPRYDQPDPARSGVYGAARPADPDPRFAPPDAGRAARPVVRHTETVDVTTRHTVVDGPDPGAGHLGGCSPAPEERSWGGPTTPEPDESPWAGYADPHDRPEPLPEDRWPGQPAGHEPGWTGQRGEPGRTGRRDEPGRAGTAGRARPYPAAEAATGDPVEEGGTEGARSYRAGEAAAGRARPYPAQEAPAGRARPYPAGEIAGRGQWSEAHAGDRWAEVREDERGREVRVGERRAAAHADAAGTAYRVEDRWAAVRHGDSRQDPGEPWQGREEAGRWPGEDRVGAWPDAGQARGRHDDPDADWERGRHDADWERGRHDADWERGRHDEPDAGAEWGDGGWRDRRALPDAAAPALPAGGEPVPTEWRQPARRGTRSGDRWREPEPARPSRHQRADEERYGYPPRDDLPRAGGRSSDRWR
ncbi:hypothetical protein ACFY2R_08820 [Micromonospora olivasterospora]|uniref:Uncharacterized protein n=1 Tax=Micromonospora olivasterospora TaxID=1880 RepID=A0A562I856_MICOL|nr:hypothetical protein [Micromonospora olivasterospora]TWH66968.1 hypothetical protein JD77_01929 [Micromonospora olivasterospora]